VADPDHWLGLARWSPLAVLADLDGTLIRLAPTPAEARPDEALLDLLRRLSVSPGLTMAVVSGRPRETLESYFEACPHLFLVAEHGGWRRGAGAWEPFEGVRGEEVDDLTAALRAVAARYEGALVERKTWSVTFHVRRVAPEERDAALVEVENLVESWLAGHPGFAELEGAEVVEVRPARMDKSTAAAWLRNVAGAGCRLLALGDDVTDEDMFRGLTREDEGVLVGSERIRTTAARWALDSVAAARDFLAWMLGVREGTAGARPEAYPRPVPVPASPGRPRPDGPHRLLVVSNRLPELRSTADATDASDARKRLAGGLVSALVPALSERRGVWLGWSGRTVPGADPTRVGHDADATPELAWVDFPDELTRDYYNGFCNGALWPLLHTFPARVRFASRDWEAYRRANAAFADAATALVGPHDTVWVHDYHLFLLGRCLRERGHQGPVGLFLHVPFPGPDVFFLLPWAEEVLAALLELDLVGFHTPEYAANFRRCASVLSASRVGDDVVSFRNRRTRIGVFPIGVIPEQFQDAPDDFAEAERLVRAIAPGRLVLGVDRLDYTKGIPERLQAFGRLLATWPEWRRRVSLVQISVPSRGDVPEYAEQRERVERIVGRVNGEMGDADWVPVRYLYRSFRRRQLALLYRRAAVGYVTPLRDGMNLVAKEYVAAQDPEDPGVLLLSRFAGAAVELDAALLTNPWHEEGLARDLDQALRMGLPERRARHARLLERVHRTTALTWAEDFLAALARCAPPRARSDVGGVAVPR
jgi:trehalose 6-phosphate synthase